MQKERKAKDKAAAAKRLVKADSEWSGDDFVKQSDALARG
jgi:dihydropyrimidine dehydrogenase (NADP+)/dihydropyrimidine dehydrogenase (NAD+) subunit PreA